MASIRGILLDIDGVLHLCLRFGTGNGQTGKSTRQYLIK